MRSNGGVSHPSRRRFAPPQGEGGAYQQSLEAGISTSTKLLEGERALVALILIGRAGMPDNIARSP
jgi:hypothetical protein